MAEKKQRIIDDRKMNDFVNKNWADYQKAQKKTAPDKKATSTAKKKVKRK